MKSRLASPIVASVTCLCASAIWMGGCHTDEREALDLPTDTDTSDWSPVGKIITSANRHYFKERDLARRKFRARIANVIALVDHMEVLFLRAADDPILDSERTFSILPYQKKVAVNHSIDVSEEDLPLFRKAFSGLLANSNSSGGAWDHQPNVAIRLFSGGKLIFSTSISWASGNYFLTYPDDLPEDASWVGFQGATDLKLLTDRLEIKQH